MKAPSTRHAFGRRGLIAAGAAALAAPSIARAQGQAAGGVALVIGNSRYSWEAPLPNVRRDVADVAKRFQAYGLKTELLQDAGRDAMRRGIDAFIGTVRGARFAALYYAGHGASWARDTYLVPVDIDLGTPSVVQSLISVPEIGKAMNAAAQRLLIFDTCRNNPADGWRQREAQRSAVTLSYGQGSGPSIDPNTLILYSTAPGRTALDGPAGQTSPFASVFLRQFDGPVDLQTLPARMRRDLLMATQGRQVLWDTNTFAGSFVLNAAKDSGAAGPSGWALDPGRLAELPKAYAYAQQNGIPLPAGLVAHRPRAQSRDGVKIGAFGWSAVQQNGAPASPQLLVVLSVDEASTAEVILAGKYPVGYWRFLTASLSGSQLEFVPMSGGNRFLFEWKDANAGTIVFTPVGSSTSTRIGGANFTRLDG